MQDYTIATWEFHSDMQALEFHSEARGWDFYYDNGVRIPILHNTRQAYCKESNAAPPAMPHRLQNGFNIGFNTVLNIWFNIRFNIGSMFGSIFQCWVHYCKIQNGRQGPQNGLRFMSTNNFR